jgi:branched-chain amino acid transport system permease protein
MDFELWLAQMPFTLTLAAVYSLYAAGFVLIFGVLKVLNLAYAFTFMFAANVAVWLTLSGTPLLLAGMGAVAVAMCLGAITDQVAFRPLRSRRRAVFAGLDFGPLMATLAVGFILEGLARQAFGVRTKSFPPDAFPRKFFDLGGVTVVSVLQICVVASAIVLLLLLRLLITRTAFGKAMRAIAANREMAGLVGINTRRIESLVWIVSSALTGIAGVYIGLVARSVSPVMGSSYQLKGLIVVVVGGMGSVTGALIAAVLLAVVETGSVLTVGGQYRDLISLVMIVVILLARPNGLFGSRGRDV